MDISSITSLLHQYDNTIITGGKLNGKDPTSKLTTDLITYSANPTASNLANLETDMANEIAFLDANGMTSQAVNLLNNFDGIVGSQGISSAQTASAILGDLQSNGTPLGPNDPVYKALIAALDQAMMAGNYNPGSSVGLEAPQGGGGMTVQIP